MNYTTDREQLLRQAFNSLPGVKQTTVEPWQVRQAREQGLKDGFEHGRAYEREECETLGDERYAEGWRDGSRLSGGSAVLMFLIAGVSGFVSGFFLRELLLWLWAMGR